MQKKQTRPTLDHIRCSRSRNFLEGERVYVKRNTEADRSSFIHCEDNGWNNPSLSSGSS